MGTRLAINLTEPAQVRALTPTRRTRKVSLEERDVKHRPRPADAGGQRAEVRMEAREHVPGDTVGCQGHREEGKGMPSKPSPPGWKQGLREDLSGAQLQMVGARSPQEGCVRAGQGGRSQGPAGVQEGVWVAGAPGNGRAEAGGHSCVRRGSQQKPPCPTS